jgi:hypothetical protein
VTYEEMPQKHKDSYPKGRWAYTLLDNYSGFTNHYLGISLDAIAIIAVEENDNNNRVVNTTSDSYCSCSNPNFVENYALSKRFFVCRNCGKEKE